MEHADAAQVAALVGALGAVLVLLPRDRWTPLGGFLLLGLAAAGLVRSLVSHSTLHLLFTQRSGLALVVVGVLTAAVLAYPFVRYPTVVPVALLAVAPFRIPVGVGNENAFLLLPLYLVLASSVLALAYRMIRGDRPSAPSLFLALPLAALAVYTTASFLWTRDARHGGVALAFFLFPFVAGFAVVARAPIASWLPRALTVTLVALATVFAAIGLWQAHTRTLIFAHDLVVRNAYTTFFRVNSLFKDPSLYGRYLVVPMAMLLVVLWMRRGRRGEWIVIAALLAFLFAGLYFSYSQSSFVALFAVTFAVAFLGVGRKLRAMLLVCALIAALAAAAFAAEAARGRSLRDVTSSRSRLVTSTLDAFETSPIYGVGIGGQPKASVEAAHHGSVRRTASHTTPLTELAELGVVGFLIYVWTLAAFAWGLLEATRRDRAFGIGLAAVLFVLFVHSLLYAGFFEDPLTWGVFGLTTALLVAEPAPVEPQPAESEELSVAQRILAH